MIKNLLKELPLLLEVWSKALLSAIREIIRKVGKFFKKLFVTIWEFVVQVAKWTWTTYLKFEDSILSLLVHVLLTFYAFRYLVLLIGIACALWYFDLWIWFVFYLAFLGVAVYILLQKTISISESDNEKYEESRKKYVSWLKLPARIVVGIILFYGSWHLYGKQHINALLQAHMSSPRVMQQESEERRISEHLTYSKQEAEEQREAEELARDKREYEEQRKLEALAREQKEAEEQRKLEALALEQKEAEEWRGLDELDRTQNERNQLTILNSMKTFDYGNLSRLLEFERDNITKSWRNSFTNNMYTVTPIRVYFDNKHPCRSYSIVAEINGQKIAAIDTACRRLNESRWDVRGGR